MTIPGIFLLLVLIYLSVDWIKLVRYIHNYYVGYDTYKLYKDGREGKIYHYDKALRRRVYIERLEMFQRFTPYNEPILTQL